MVETARKTRNLMIVVLFRGSKPEVPVFFGGRMDDNRFCCVPILDSNLTLRGSKPDDAGLAREISTMDD